ncbi:MAG: BamA/TamA family outer membrane protein [Gemmatimonadetes bacterium]|nr:BamA/TamA family outer membrane protein [Gemmatimonadota bacterium]
MTRRASLRDWMRGGRVAVVVLAFGPAPLGTLAAQTAPVASTVRVAPGPQYEAGWLHRLLLGGGYRELWTTPLEAEPLDLATFGAGLTPHARGGGFQTRSLRFHGGDGREYAFRSLDKDPGPTLRPELRGTIVHALYRDQTSAAFPAGALLAAPLARAAGVLHAAPRLVVMPDDPGLGEFRAEFAGMLGTIEERPDETSDGRPGFAGAAHVIGTERLLERIARTSRERVDARAYLTARLRELLIGDWDRHEDQWRWAGYPGGDGWIWRPIARDRDQAFSSYGGWLLALARVPEPKLVRFQARYPDPMALSWQSLALDRRLLAELDWPAWDSAAAQLVSAIPDSVLERAVSALPPAHADFAARTLLPVLRARRDRLPEAARQFYDWLSGAVDVHATDERDLALVERGLDGSEQVTLSRASGVEDDVVAPYFRRRFDPHVTREIRLYLHGRDDRVTVHGEAQSSILVRIVGGHGDDAVTDSSRVAGRGRTTLVYYDDHGRNRVLGAETRFDARPNAAPRRKAPRGPEDWGVRSLPLPWIDVDPDRGLLLGLGVQRTRYGFRQSPYASRTVLRAGYAFAAEGVRLQYRADFHPAMSRRETWVALFASNAEFLRFHGYGNETREERSENEFRVDQRVLRLEAGSRLPVTERLALSFGSVLEWQDTDAAPNGLLEETRPYGVGEFGALGVSAAVELDTRDHRRFATRGLRLRADASAYPPLWDAEQAFGTVRLEAAAHLGLRGEDAVLALRGGGERTWGLVPLQHAAFLGGRNLLHGYREQRFAGDAAVYGNAELRLSLGEARVAVPEEYGVFALADLGRVFLDGERSDQWHGALGAGIWLALVDRANTLSLAVARGERTAVYARLGFMS